MEKAVRYSKKREAILQAIKNTDCHPTAEWVYQTLKPEHPDLSLGTVYRNLVFFQKQLGFPHFFKLGFGSPGGIH